MGSYKLKLILFLEQSHYFDFDDDDDFSEEETSSSHLSLSDASGSFKKEDFWKENYAYWDKVDTEDLHDALMGDDIAAEFMDDMYGEDGW